MQRLVSLVCAQHQAWSERLATRASLLQSTLTHNTDRVSPAPPPATASSVSNQHPPPLSHDQDVGREVHHHSPTSLHHPVESVASHPYAYPQALLRSQNREGVSLGGHPTAALQDSLSIFTLSTRYAVWNNNMLQIIVSLILYWPWKQYTGTCACMLH